MEGGASNNYQKESIEKTLIIVICGALLVEISIVTLHKMVNHSIQLKAQSSFQVGSR